ncbi:MAG: helix-hairpin-helix domain-containing protein [Candidatus Omnitrophota bacterium]
MKLERPERIILVFLTGALILGITVSAIRKIKSPAAVTIEKFDTESYKEPAASIPGAPVEKIDINVAGREEFEKIKGIGKTIAGRIVEYRYRNGPFDSIDELKNVKGLGAALFEKIKDRIKVE